MLSFSPEHTPPSRPLQENLRFHALRDPERTAIIYYGKTVTYGELWRDAERLAATLAGRLGVRPGDRVALDMQNCPQFIAAYYAILVAGGVVVPLNPMYRPAEVARMMKDAGARVAILASELLDRFTGWEGAEELALVVARYADALPDAPVGPPPAVALEPAPVEADARVLPWDAALAAGAGLPAPAPPADFDPAAALCVMPYTSGSTGTPKGCPHTHAAAMHTAALQVEWYRMTQASVITAVQPLFHVAGMQGSMNAGILAGGALLVMTRWDAAAAARLFADYGPTFFNGPPTMIIDLLSHADFTDAAFRRLEVITGGGSAMPVAVAERLRQRFGLTYVEGYGMSETMSPTHLNPLAAPVPGSIGVPVQETLALIVDPETLAPLPDGETGEILVAGPQVIARYWGDRSAGSFVEIDGVRMLRTGDLGYRDARGYYYVVDRLKRMINASGFKVWPAEVEEVLFAHPDVEQCCVVAAPDPYRGETVAAAVILHPHARGRTTAADLVAWCRERLAAFKVPRRVTFVETLPRTAAHKIDWRQVQEQLAAGGAAAAE